jgi:DNA-binding FadR family transcriptional regulator
MRRPHQAAEAIKNWIVEQRLLPGDRLPTEQELIQQFNMAKGTIREAMRIMEAQGLVMTRTGPGGGAFVHAVSEARAQSLLGNYFFFKNLTIADIYQIRQALEPELVASLAGRITEEDLRGLEKIMENYAVPADDAETERQYHIDSLRFHAALAELSKNDLLGFLIRFMTTMLSDLTVYRKLYDPPNRELWKKGLSYQRRLIKALRCGHGEEARHIMQAHMLTARRQMEIQEGEMERRFISEQRHSK